MGTTKKHFFTRQRLQVIVILISLVIIVPQLKWLGQVSEKIKDLNTEWLWLAGCLGILCYFFAALVYCFLVPRKLPYGRTLLVQFAGSFANRIIPSGIGALGVSTLYIAKQVRISKPEAATYAGINNLLGFVGFGLISIVGYIYTGESIKLPRAKPLYVFVLVTGLVCIVLALRVLGHNFKPIRKKIFNALGSVKGVLNASIRHPFRLALAFSASLALSLCNLLVFYACAAASGVSLSPFELIVVFGAGALAIAVSPTPNGLGAAEISMVATLSYYGVSSASAISLVVLYRLISYWLPIIPGYLAFRRAVNKRYI